MNDTLIFLVLAGLALIFRWLTSHASDESEKSEPPPNETTAPRRPPAQTDEERVRRFLEALGVPQGTRPPPPVRPRKVVTPTVRKVVTPTQPATKPKVKRSLLQPLPPLVTTPADVPAPARSVTPPPIVVTVEAPPAVEFPRSVSSAIQPVQPIPARPLAITSLHALLHSRASLRQAIILREVLGPPRAFQPFTAIQGF